MSGRLLQLAGWIWVLVVAGFYFVSHPLTGDLPPLFPAAHLWSSIAPGLSACLLILAGGYGWLVLFGCPPKALFTLASSWGVGLIIGGSLGTLLGLTIGFTPTGLAVLVISLLVPAWVGIRRAVQKMDLKWASPLWHSPLSLTFLVLFLGTSWFNLTGLLAPATTHDDLVYHLTIPAQYLHAGRIIDLPDLYPAYRPQNMQVISGWVGLAGSVFSSEATAREMGSLPGGADSAVRCLSWFSGLWAAILLWLALGVRFGPAAGAMAAGAFFFHPQLSWLSRTAYTDLPLLHLTIAGLIVLFETWTSVHRRSWVALGLLAACAAATKTSGLALAGFLTLAFSFLLFQRRQMVPGGPISSGLGFGLVLLIGGSFWYVRNAWFIGNPLNPHLGSLFQPWLVPPATLSAFRQVFATDPAFILSHEVLLDRFGLGHDFFNLLLLPWNVTIHGHFHDPHYSLACFDGQIGFLTLALLPFLATSIARRRNQPWYALLGGATLVSLLFWAHGSHQIRFLLPALTLLAVLTGVWLSLESGWKHLAFFLLLVSGSYSLVFSANRTARHGDFLHGQQTREAFLANQLPFFEAYQFLNQQRGRGKVISAFEERVYYLAPPCLWMPLIPDYLVSAFFAAGTPDQVHTFLSRLGVTHLYLPRTGGQALRDFFDRPAYKSGIDRFFAECAVRVFQDQAGEVWELKLK